MRKKISLLLITVLAVLALPLFAFGCTDRSNVLKIYNWGEYMDPEVYEAFEDWYYKETGETVKVKYKEFDTNESMYTEISVNKSDYDLVCPSEYMVERMKNADLLKPLDKSIIDPQEDWYYDGLWDMINDSIDEGLVYTVPYVWGTFGIMYDAGKVERDGIDVSDFDSWQAMFDSKYKKKVLMKNSVRDAYSIAQLYNRRELLSEATNGFTDYGSEQYHTELKNIFTLPSEDSVMEKNIEEAYDTLVKQKSVLIRYEVDDGKDDMANSDSQAVFGFFWSCDAGFAMDENNSLMYVVPKEGANVWVDSFVIPKYARNEKAANYFLKYLCTATVDDEEDDFDGCLVAEKNMDWMGTSVAIKGAMEARKEALEEEAEEVLAYEAALKEGSTDRDEEIEESLFFGSADGFIDMYLEMVFPPDYVLSRCEIMRDFGKFNFVLDGMWIDVKTA